MLSLVTNLKGVVTIQIDKPMAEKLYDVIVQSEDKDIVRLKEKIEKQFEHMSRGYAAPKEI
jgi:hypothetical protein